MKIGKQELSRSIQMYAYIGQAKINSYALCLCRGDLFWHWVFVALLSTTATS